MSLSNHLKLIDFSMLSLPLSTLSTAWLDIEHVKPKLSIKHQKLCQQVLYSGVHNQNTSSAVHVRFLADYYYYFIRVTVCLLRLVCIITVPAITLGRCLVIIIIIKCNLCTTVLQLHKEQTKRFLCVRLQHQDKSSLRRKVRSSELVLFLIFFSNWNRLTYFSRCSGLFTFRYTLTIA